jgi:uncharacterized repeat protein (TIGR03837 family)
MPRPIHSCAVFCRVVDNYGDAGVAWRLARQLAHEHGLDVTLFIDGLARLARIEPGLDAAARAQRYDEVGVRAFDDVASATPADLVVDIFGCGIPERYLDTLERATRPAIWVVLEYLTAEAWVEGVHGRPSPPPGRTLQRWFYCPGFVAGTGGLLRERDLLERRDAHARSIGAHAKLWRGLGLDALPPDALVVSLFCYANRATPALLERWRRDAEPIVCVVPEGVAREALGDARPGFVSRERALTIVVAPFVNQDAFDARLWSSALDFVRGEDSFVRAQWAARPLVWHIYPQAQGAHLAKLAAFHDLYLRDLATGPGVALRRFTEAWNAQDPDATAAQWPALRAALPALSMHARAWCDRLAHLPDLASGLVEFAGDRL